MSPHRKISKIKIIKKNQIEILNFKSTVINEIFAREA